jgi:ornithine cyclodeaminase/alanine dehydrogenase-like protein (mu-crystallin family)
MASVTAPVRLLTRSQVRSMLRWPELIEATTQALIAASAGQIAPTDASQLHVPGAALHLKSGALLQPPVLTVKANLRPEAGSSAGLIVAFDPVRFAVRAVLDSADITAMRTGAIAAAAARQLARPGRHTLAVIGAGPVSRQALAALEHVLEIGEVRMWSRDRVRAEQVAAELATPAEVSATPDEAAAGAGIVLTATPSRQPLLTAAKLAPDALVLAMGADTRGKRELAEDVLEGAELVADVPAEAVKVGEFAYLPDGAAASRCAELGQLLAGRQSLPPGQKGLRPGQKGLPPGQQSLPERSAGRRIVFDSVGTAVTDAAAVGLVLAAAERESVGALVDFAS